MIALYCRDVHGTAGGLCADCEGLRHYAEERLRLCPFGPEKPTCLNCRVHCYKPASRDEVRTVMRHSGPRMLLRHPWLTIVHQLDGFRKVSHPRELTRKERLRSRDS